MLCLQLTLPLAISQTFGAVKKKMVVEGWTASALLAATVLLLIYIIHQLFLLPKPLPEIPYRKDATKTIFGDMLRMISHISQTGEMFDWLGQQCIELESPLVQVFARPLSRPWLVLCDFRETQDILLRRSKEFDRSDFTADLFAGLMPNHHIRLQTNEEYKQHRRLLQDLMSPAFLQAVAGPNIYDNARRLTSLWKQKMRVCGARPFSAIEDVSHFALDSVLAFTLGCDGVPSANQTQLDYITSLAKVDDGSEEEEEHTLPFDFSGVPHEPDVDALLVLSCSLETSLKAPTPKLAHWMLRQTGSYRNALARKEQLLSRAIQAAVCRAGNDESDSSALDNMVRREMGLAEKESREPAFDSRVFYDEVFGVILGGHETTSNSQLWALKLLARHQEQQTKLRDCLRLAMSAAVTENRMPTVQEIFKQPCPYLDATIEELFRLSMTAPACVRKATCDTTLLGHFVPQGTNVVMVWSGADYTAPGLPISEEQRSPSCQSAAGKRVASTQDTMDGAKFRPERWLSTTEGRDGQEVFDATLARNMIFSLGPRGCFGRRLAYVEFRIWLVLVVWEFHLARLPSRLDSDKAWDKLTRQPQDCFISLRPTTV